MARRIAFQRVLFAAQVGSSATAGQGAGARQLRFAIEREGCASFERPGDVLGRRVAWFDVSIAWSELPIAWFDGGVAKIDGTGASVGPRFAKPADGCASFG
ncbi:MAG TPA: hypothetical protein VH044_08420 [Polyangiaceae bacterium]|nr:hypothetical protein [Polyangiaceae bacterium]